MALELTIKRNDHDPVVRATITNADGTAFDLTGYVSPKFIMSADGGTTQKVNATAVIEAPATGGIMRYDWPVGGSDTDTTGTYKAEFEAVSAAGRKRTFPTSEYITIKIKDDLDNA